MEDTYKIAAKYCAYIHLGLIPDYDDDGICPNLRHFLYDSVDCKETALLHIHALGKELSLLFKGLGLHPVYPVEGSSESYARAGDKYRGRHADKRRELAGLMAQHFNQKLMQDTFKR